MSFIRVFIGFFLLLHSPYIMAQCNQVMTIHTVDGICDGNGSTSVTVNISIVFGNGNNSVTLGYNMGSGDVYPVTIDDDSGDIITTDFNLTVPTCGSFAVVMLGWTNPAGGGSSCNNQVKYDYVLPVSFGQVTTSNIEHGIQIAWTTYSEMNNSTFNIQRLNESSKFEIIGSVNGSGNSNQILHYTFNDNNPQSGINYYRIEQIDYDLNHSYSETVGHKNIIDEDISIYPNPADGYFYIKSKIPAPYFLIDALGNVILEISPLEEKVNVQSLHSGMYYLTDKHRLFIYRVAKL